MANPYKGEVSFEVNGDNGAAKTYTIRLNTDTLCSIEAEFGIGFGEVARRLDAFNFLTLRAVMRRALGANTTLAEASAAIDEVGYTQAVNHIMEAYRLAYPPADDADPRMGSEPGTGTSP